MLKGKKTNILPDTSKIITIFVDENIQLVIFTLKTINTMKTTLISCLLMLCSLAAFSKENIVQHQDTSRFDTRPPITPAWMLGHVVWEDQGNTQQSTLQLVREYLDHDIPVDAVIIDSPWSTGYNNFEWDLTRYPDHEGMADMLLQWGVKPILWLTGVVNETSKGVPLQKCDTYDLVVKKKLGINLSQPSEWWKGTGVQIDFTNKKARQWFYTQLDKVFNHRFFGFKVDQGEVYFGDTVTTSVGTMANQDFRKYYYDALFDYVNSRKPGIGGIVARPYSHQKGYHAGVQKMSMGWCGDFGGDWNGLKLQIDNIYKSANAGYGAVATEIAGFMGAKSNHNQFIRYTQFGCMTACMINGGENGAFTNHLPWWQGDDALEIYRYCVNLHRELVPYIFSALVDAHNEGGSLIKVHSFDEESHILGDEIFIKAITADGDGGKFKLPEGDEWVNFFNGSHHEGGTVINSDADMGKFNLYVRRGAVLPLNVENDVTGIGTKADTGRKTLLFYPYGITRKTIHWPLGDGIEYADVNVEMDAQNGTIHVDSKQKFPFTIIVREQKPVKDVKGATCWTYDTIKRTLKIYASGNDINISIIKE